jgi:D-alanyl-D-alanine dipeptidase
MSMRVLPWAAAVCVGLACAAPAGAAPEGAVPPVSPQARAAGLVDVRSVVPDAIVDLRYTTANNFTGVQLYPAGAERTSGG